MGGDLQIFGLFGNPVRESLSPLMHNAALSRMGIDGRYMPFCVRNLRDAVAGIRGMGIRGVSVTVPFKVAIMEYLDEIDDDARQIGAVNTITNEGGRLVGSNTDWLGLVSVLLEAMEISGKTFAIVGAGGTARAALFGILQNRGKPLIVNRTKERGQQLADAWGCPFYDMGDITRIEADCLVNTTPVGMRPNTEDTPIPPGTLKHFTWVMDVIYTPLKTRLLRDAELAGCTALSGFGMFVQQGVEQLKKWTGKEPPREYMGQIVREKLASQAFPCGVINHVS